MKKIIILSVLSILLIGLGAANTSAARVDVYGKLPQSFEPNHGQTDGRVKFLSRGRGYTLYLTEQEAVLSLSRRGPRPRSESKSSVRSKPDKIRKSILRMQFVGANPKPVVDGVDKLTAKSHYLIGKNSAKWHKNIPHYAKVRYREVYPGIDVLFYGNQSQLEYDFVVAPGANPSAVILKFQGAKTIELNQGDLVLKTGEGAVRIHQPVIYQEVDGAKQAVKGKFVLKDTGHVGFHVAAYDKKRPLIIDPVLVYATYLGGADDQEFPTGIVVDASGNTYITGDTDSPDFPTTPGSFDTICGTDGFCNDQLNTSLMHDVFVTKLGPDGSSLVYSAFVGGSDDDFADAIAIDTAGNAYVTGDNDVTDFPTTTGAFREVPGEVGGGVYVFKLSADGSGLVYSTYLGAGSGRGFSIAVDGDGNAYVTGNTRLASFPATPGSFDTSCGTDGTCNGGNSDAYVAKVNPAGSALVYATFLGGGDIDVGRGIDIDAAGNAYVTGDTSSDDFPTAGSPFQNTMHISSLQSAFVAKVNPAGSALVYSTYLGGASSDSGRGVAVDVSGNTYVTGTTISSDFPTTAGSFDTICGTGSFCNGQLDVYVTKLNADGSGLIYSTFLGGSATESIRPGHPIALDSFGNAYVTGHTSSADFPATADAIQLVFAGGDRDGFVSELSADGSTLIFSTYFGGSSRDSGAGIAVDGVGTAYALLQTDSIGLTTLSPNASGPFQPELAGAGGVITIEYTGVVSEILLSSLAEGLYPGITVGDPIAGQVIVSVGAPDEQSSNSVGQYRMDSSTLTIRDKRLEYATAIPDGSSNATIRSFVLGDQIVMSAATTNDVYFLDTSWGLSPGTLANDSLAELANQIGGFITINNAGVDNLCCEERIFSFNISGTTARTLASARPDVYVAKLSLGGDTPDGSEVVTQPIEPETGESPALLTFETVTTSGTTTLDVSATGPPPPSGFSLGDPATYYDITTSATFTGSVEVCIYYGGVSFADESTLTLQHFDETAQAWVDVTTSQDTVNDVICGSVTSLSPFAVFGMPPKIIVAIDIKPGSDPNCFNNNGNGVIPVAILGSDNLDVTQIDAATVQLAALAVKAVGKSKKLLATIEDVNDDGFNDLSVKIEDSDTVFTEGTAETTLTGNLIDGTPFVGTDSICIVP